MQNAPRKASLEDAPACAEIRFETGGCEEGLPEVCLRWEKEQEGDLL